MKNQHRKVDCGMSLISALGNFKNMLVIKTFLGILLLAAYLPVIALAADGDVLWTVEGIGQIPSIVSDRNGGVIVAGGSSKLCYYHDQYIEISRIDHSGVVTTWDTSAINAESPAHTHHVEGVAEDGYGGLLLFWLEAIPTEAGCDYDGSFITRFDANGTNLWGKIQIPSSQAVISMCGDGVGGAYVLRDTTVLHYSPEGVLTGQLDVASNPLSKGIKLLSDKRDKWIWVGGELYHQPGGLYVLWREAVDLGNNHYRYPLRAQWINGGKKWGADGVELVDDIGTGGSSNYSPFIEAARNGNDGLLVSWQKISNQLRVQSINNSGIKQWGSDGTVVVDPAIVGGNWSAPSNYCNTITPDGTGGAILAWTDWRNAGPDAADPDIYARRVSSDGSLLWGSDVLLPPTIIGGLAPGTQEAPIAVADGNGGALITFADYYFTAGYRVALTRISSDGVKLFSGYYPYVFNDSCDMRPTGIIFDKSGPTATGAIIAWIWTGDWSEATNVAKVEINNDPPANDSCDNALTIGLGEHTGTLIRATNDGENTCGSLDQPDVWYRFIAPYTGELLINTCGTNDMGGVDAGMDTELSVHQGACSDTSSNQLPSACNNDASICGGEDLGVQKDSVLTLQVVHGDVLLIRISKFASSIAMDFKFSVNYLDQDLDNDGVLDSQDICPGFDDTLDSDGDGIPDGCDICAYANNATTTDCNNNLVPDSCDLEGLGDFEDFNGSGMQSYHLNGMAVVDHNACRLTPALDSQLGSIIFDPVSDRAMESFTLSFDYKIGGGGGADGLSFALLDSSIYDTTLNFDENGPGMGSLTVKFNTYFNTGEISDNFIALLLNGAMLTTFTPSFDINDNQWRHVDVIFSGSSLTMEITGPDGNQETVFNNFPIPAFIPFVALYGFGARTGAVNDEHWVDNIYFNDTTQSNDVNGNNVPDDCEFLQTDFNHDHDVDGADLAELLANPSLSNLHDFAENFGKIN